MQDLKLKNSAKSNEKTIDLREATGTSTDVTLKSS